MKPLSKKSKILFCLKHNVTMQQLEKALKAPEPSEKPC